jgi:hypothetical protein
VEERLYLKTYLAGAGALLVKFGKWLLDRGSTTSGQLRDDSVIERLMIEALNDYLGLATEIRDRTAIRRERERLAREDYSSATKRHKRYPLLTTMLRLRLLRGNEEGSDVLEPIQPDVNGRLASVSRTLPSIEALERLIRAEKLQETLDVEMREYDRNDLPSGQDPTALLAKAYAFSMDSGMQACPLSYLDDVLLSAFPASPQRAPLSAERMVEPIHRAKPSEVRFHVDRRGRRAFVLFSEGALREFQTTHG